MRPFGNRYNNQHKHIVSIGGGTASTLELPFLVAEKYGWDNVDLVIAALAGESRDLWRMIDWLEKQSGKEVIRVAWSPKPVSLYYNKTTQYYINPPTWMYPSIWDAFRHTRFLGNSRIDPCSRLLKRETMRAFVLDHYAPERATLHVGIGSHEIDRILNIRKNWGSIGIEVEALLADQPQTTLSSGERAKEILGWEPFIYAWGGSHNNCGGFCVKSGLRQLEKLLWHDKETYLYHENQELQFRDWLGRDDITIFNRVRNNEKTRLTLQEFRMEMEAKWQGAMFDPHMTLEEDETGCIVCMA